LTQEGLDPESGKAVSVAVEMSADQKPMIRVTASWGDVAARTIHIPATDLPGFDISTVSLFLRPSGEHEGSASLRALAGIAAIVGTTKTMTVLR
jgi:hypothetical protein